MPPLKLTTSVALPCGITLENRLVKVTTTNLYTIHRYAYSNIQGAMAEGLADSVHMPDENAVMAYGNWADGGWGLIITGMHAPFL